MLFHGDPGAILNALLTRKGLPPKSREVTAILFGPGLDRLWRPASVTEVELWERLAAPSPFAALLREGHRREAIEAMIHAGALEYA